MNSILIFLFVFRRLNRSVFASCRILCLSVLYCIAFILVTSLLSSCFHIFHVLIFFGGISSIAAFIVCLCMMNFHAIMCSSACPLLIAFPSFLFLSISIFWSISACVFFPPLLLLSCHSLTCIVSSIWVCISCISRNGPSFRVLFHRICTEPFALSCSSRLVSCFYAGCS